MAAQQVHCSLQQIAVQSVVLWSDPSPTVTVLTFIVSSTLSSLNPGQSIPVPRLTTALF